jgi:hypothetical protein
MAATSSPAKPTPSAQEDYDVYVVKLDANGNLQWTKTIGGKKDDVGLMALIQTSDGGYAIAGYTTSFGAGNGDVYVVKLDANGTSNGPKPSADQAMTGHSLIQTSDGGYAIAGSTQSFGAGGDDVYVVKLDANGNLQWTKTIGGPKDDWGILPHSDLRWRLRHRRLHPILRRRKLRCLCRQAGCQW